MLNSCVVDMLFCILRRIKFFLMGFVFIVVIGYIDFGNFVINI